MVASERLVLFHDAPPQGSSHAEVMEAGFGLARSVVVLPHARRRLHAHETRNMAVFARRFEPGMCVLLDDGSRIDWRGRRWSGLPGTRRVATTGTIEEVAGPGVRVVDSATTTALAVREVLTRAVRERGPYGGHVGIDVLAGANTPVSAIENGTRSRTSSRMRGSLMPYWCGAGNWISRASHFWVTRRNARAYHGTRQPSSQRVGA